MISAERARIRGGDRSERGFALDEIAHRRLRKLKANSAWRLVTVADLGAKREQSAMRGSGDFADLFADVWSAFHIGNQSIERDK